MDLDYFVKYFNEHDGFSKHNGLKLLKMEPGYAEAEFTVSDDNLNFMGTIHGGVLFGLVDIVAGSSLAAYGSHCVTLSSNITYVAAAKSGRVFASSKEVSRTRRTATYDIEVKDEGGRVLCKAVTTMYIPNKPIEFDKDGNMVAIN